MKDWLIEILGTALMFIGGYLWIVLVIGLTH